MHFLRLLRIFIPLLLVAAVVAGIVVVVTSRHELQSSRHQVDTQWNALRPALDERYSALQIANDTVKDVPGPLHQISTQVSSAYANWRDLEQHNGSVSSEVTAANNLESLGRRLVISARAAPRLVGQTQALGAISVYAGLQPPAGAADFDTAVTHFEHERSRPARSLAARILGYTSIPTYAVTTTSSSRTSRFLVRTKPVPRSHEAGSSFARSRAPSALAGTEST